MEESDQGLECRYTCVAKKAVAAAAQPVRELGWRDFATPIVNGAFFLFFEHLQYRSDDGPGLAAIAALFSLAMGIYELMTIRHERLSYSNDH